jgi:serine/threonine protein kinase
MTELTGQNLGRYHILAQLGEGGMASVYEAVETQATGGYQGNPASAQILRDVPQAL